MGGPMQSYSSFKRRLCRKSKSYHWQTPCRAILIYLVVVDVNAQGEYCPSSRLRRNRHSDGSTNGAAGAVSCMLLCTLVSLDQGSTALSPAYKRQTVLVTRDNERIISTSLPSAHAWKVTQSLRTAIRSTRYRLRTAESGSRDDRIRHGCASRAARRGNHDTSPCAGGNCRSPLKQAYRDKGWGRAKRQPLSLAHGIRRSGSISDR
jgi:hypothetical protein